MISKYNYKKPIGNNLPQSHNILSSCFQLMEVGANGVNGTHALLHVMVVNKVEPGRVIIQLQPMEDQIAASMVQPPPIQKYVIHSPAQVHFEQHTKNTIPKGC